MLTPEDKSSGDLSELIAAERQRRKEDHLLAAEEIKLLNKICHGQTTEGLEAEQVISYLACREVNLQHAKTDRPDTWNEWGEGSLIKTTTALNGGRVGVGDFCLAQANNLIDLFDGAIKSEIPEAKAIAVDLYNFGKNWLAVGLKIDPQNPNKSRIQERIVQLDKLI